MGFTKVIIYDDVHHYYYYFTALVSLERLW